MSTVVRRIYLTAYVTVVAACLAAASVLPVAAAQAPSSSPTATSPESGDGSSGDVPVMLVLDSSGSMSEDDAGGTTRLAAAKEATKGFVEELTVPRYEPVAAEASGISEAAAASGASEAAAAADGDNSVDAAAPADAAGGLGQAASWGIGLGVIALIGAAVFAAVKGMRRK